MALGDEVLSRLKRTMQSIFRIGSVNIKDNSGVVDLRNSADSAYAEGAAHSLRLHGSNATHYIGLSAPAGLSAAQVFVMPNDDGSQYQLLGTDGAGNLGWYNAVANAELVQQEAFTQATSSPVTIFTPPANALITRVQIALSVAAAGGAPTLSVGTVADPDRDFDELDIDMSAVGTYEVEPNTDVGGSPAAVILTITPDGQTFSGTVRVFYTVPA